MDHAYGFELNGEQVFSLDTLASGVFIESTDEGQGVAIPWCLVPSLIDVLNQVSSAEASGKGALPPLPSVAPEKPWRP